MTMATATRRMLERGRHVGPYQHHGRRPCALAIEEYVLRDPYAEVGALPPRRATRTCQGP